MATTMAYNLVGRANFLKIFFLKHICRRVCVVIASFPQQRIFAFFTGWKQTLFGRGFLWDQNHGNTSNEEKVSMAQAHIRFVSKATLLLLSNTSLPTATLRCCIMHSALIFVPIQSAYISAQSTRLIVSSSKTLL